MTLHTLRTAAPTEGQLIRRLLKVDGTVVELPGKLPLETLRQMMGADCIDTVSLHQWRGPLHVMLVDDDGYECQTIQHPNLADGTAHIEVKPVYARRPMNAEATRLYHEHCHPGTEHQIVGDVVIVPDDDFA